MMKGIPYPIRVESIAYDMVCKRLNYHRNFIFEKYRLRSLGSLKVDVEIFYWLIDGWFEVHIFNLKEIHFGEFCGCKLWQSKIEIKLRWLRKRPKFTVSYVRLKM